jgi:hypothetical protein
MTKGTENKCSKSKIAAKILAAVSVLLILVSFFTPPRFVIDSSVFVATGELLAWGSLFFAWDATERGIDAKFKHKGTELELNNPDK